MADLPESQPAGSTPRDDSAEGGTPPAAAPSRSGDLDRWHAQTREEVVARIGSAGATGLSLEQAARRLAQFGPNALPEARRRSLLSLVLSQFQSPLIYLLFVSAAIALLLGHYSDAVVILVVVVVNAAIGALQEGRAERSLEALHRLSQLTVRVLREGHEAVVAARELVPGDILLLTAGDAVAADARVLDAAAVEVAEAALTGESMPVAKHPHPLADETVLADRRNMLYAGTHMTAGRARAVVVATASATEVGRIASLTAAAEPPKTPLEQRIASFGRALVVAALVLTAVVITVGLLRGLPLADVLMVAISQMVSMIPEGLPVAMTIALAVGVQRMAGRGAIVRRLSAVETLGSTNVICSDKTGTLTRNEMTVTTVYLPGERSFEVSGVGYRPDGRFLEAGNEVWPGDDPALFTLLEAVALCNDAELLPPEGEEQHWRASGDPTEAALITLALKGGVDLKALRGRHPRRAEIPFDSAARMMATQHDTAGRDMILLKGAPEAILELCDEIQIDGRHVAMGAARAEIRAAAEEMASRALRVLAVAVVHDEELEPVSGFAPLEGRAILLGLVGQLDPPREEVREAVEHCRLASIRPVVVTGDHKTTGLAIARMLGIAREGDLAVDGRELAELSDEALDRDLERISVFARVHPAQKLRIVEAFQRRGAVVAMTGDGVNDAPALAKADVGVAMGITGTEVAKEAARIVITDDNFATIVAAVEEGRVIYRNLKKLILYLFSTSMAEVVVLVSALMAGLPLPLTAVQILWINLVTEGTVTINLIMEPPEGDEMRRSPVDSGEPLLSRDVLSRMFLMTPMIALSTLGFFVYGLYFTDLSFPQVQTATFTVLAVCQWFNVLNCRSTTRSALNLSVLKNRWLVGGLLLSNVLHAGVVFLPFMNDVFHTTPIPWSLVVSIGATASLVLWVEELRKLISRRWAARGTVGRAPATERT